MNEKNIEEAKNELNNQNINDDINLKNGNFYIAFATKEEYSANIKEKVKNLMKKNNLLEKDNADKASKIESLSSLNSNLENENSMYRAQLKNHFDNEARLQSYETLNFDNLSIDEQNSLSFDNLKSKVSEFAKNKNIQPTKPLEPKEIKNFGASVKDDSNLLIAFSGAGFNLKK